MKFNFFKRHMQKLECSVIIPVFNEKEGIKDFLQSIYEQTRHPNEIIVIDGGSTDGTYEYLQTQDKQGKLKAYRHPSNIAQARNFAIQKTKHEIILCTDAWCKVDKHRCEEIMHIYETTQELVVGGKSELLGENAFQKKAKLRFISADPNFHFISSRNISFHKRIREEVEWYPEYLTKRWEDTYFNYKIEQAGYKIFYCPTAIVSRHMGKDYKAFYTMYRNYTQGDAEVYMIHHIIQSGSYKQAILGTLVGGILLSCILYFPRYSGEIVLVSLVGIGLYKRSPGGFWFDLKFSIGKLLGTIIGFRKGIYTGYTIKKTIKKAK